MKPERINLQSPAAYVIAFIIGACGVLGSLAWLVVGEDAAGFGLIGLVVCGLVAFVAWKNLRHGLEFLLIDVPAGTFTHVAGKQPTTIPLDQLGPLTITKYKRLKTRRAAIWHKLEAAGLRGVLSETIDPKPTEAFKAKLERAIAASAARKVLATHSGGSGYRAAPELRSQLASAVPDATRLREALELLANDADPAVQAGAKELRSS